MYTALTDHSKTTQSHSQSCPNPCPRQTSCKGLHLYSNMTTGHNWTLTRYIINGVPNDSVVQLWVKYCMII